MEHHNTAEILQKLAVSIKHKSINQSINPNDKSPLKGHYFFFILTGDQFYYLIVFLFVLDGFLFCL